MNVKYNLKKYINILNTTTNKSKYFKEQMFKYFNFF